MTWQAVPLRASTLLDAPADSVALAVQRVDVWQRAAAAVGLRLVVPSAERWWSGGEAQIRRVGRSASSTAEVRIDDGLPTCTLTSGPAAGARLRLQLDETGAGVLLTADFGNPQRSSALPATVVGIAQTRHRRAIVEALQMFLGMVRLELRQTQLVVAAAVLRDTPQPSVLAARRAYPPALAGRWEFPGGKVDDGEDPIAALRRELVEELGVEATIGDRIGPRISLGVETVLELYSATLPDPDAVTASVHDELRWLAVGQLDEVNWLAPDIALLPALREVLGTAAPAD